MKYTDEFKRSIVEQNLSGTSITQLHQDTGVSRTSLYSWMKAYSPISQVSSVHITLRDYNLAKQRVQKLESIIQILKQAQCTLTAPLSEKLEAMEPLHGEFSGYLLCEAFEVPRGTFYNHVFRNKRSNSTYAERREILRSEIRTVFDESNQLYGAGKISAILREHGYITTEKLVAELMREMDLCSISPVSKHEYLKWKKGESKNIVQQNFHADKPNRVWVSDITVFRHFEQYYYVCVIIDLFSRKVVAFRVSKKNSTQLSTFTFRKAFADRQPEDGLIFHSDRGAQYVSIAFEKLLYQHRVVQSFSRSGRPHDNAVAESFFSYLKKEELYRHRYKSEAEMLRGIESYIAFYNGKRPHSTLQYKTPNGFEEIAHKRGCGDAVK